MKYYHYYQLLREPLFGLMIHGSRWDAEGAESRRVELSARRTALKEELDAITTPAKVHLYSIKSHRSKLYARLLDEQRACRAAKDKAGLKACRDKIKHLKETARDKDIEIGAGLSDTAIKNYLYRHLHIPARFKQRKGTGKRTETVDEIAIRRIKLEYPEHGHLLDKILEHRRCLKMEGYLNDARVDPDGRVRCMYKPFGTQSGRLSSSENPRGTGCLKGDAEVFTPQGWVRFDYVSPGPILQWNPDGNWLSFVTAPIYKTPFKGELIKAESWFHDTAYTPEHRIPVRAYLVGGATTRFLVEPAVVASRRANFKLPLAGQFVSGRRHNPDWIRLLVAAQADGTVDGKLLRFSFKKQKKIDRFLELCYNLDITPNEQVGCRDMRRWGLSVVDSFSFLQQFSAGGYQAKAKQYGNWLLEYDRETLEAFVDELRYWDAHIRGRSCTYYTVNGVNADWVQTISHLTNNSASRGVGDNRNEGSYGEFSARPLHSVSIKPRANAIVERKHWGKEAYEGDVYCALTKTGFFLCRSNGTIFITGNTNLQNMDRELKFLFEPDEG